MLAALCRRNIAHGNQARQRSLVGESSAGAAAGRSQRHGAPAGGGPPPAGSRRRIENRKMTGPRENAGVIELKPLS